MRSISIRSLLVVLTIVLTNYVYAGESHSPHHGKKDSHSPGASHWSKTLNDKQRKQVDHMHHELDRMLKPLKKDEAKKQAELNALTVQKNANMAKINKKIDELMAVKNNILRHRYAHLVEMRVILTAKQRKSYDEAVLKRSKIH